MVYFRYFYNLLFCLIRLAESHRSSAGWHAFTLPHSKWNFLHGLVERLLDNTTMGRAAKKEDLQGTTKFINYHDGGIYYIYLHSNF